ncbi:MAG TPA: virulence factor [Roseiflexaceae bacterium]|nr:virulence factor [Roseiflexaceae bacterium]HMP42867.1 virulence factor [Roseiflexaceae bacterium]
MASYQILYWHDIPLQVRVRGDGERASVALPPRFQEAVDHAAMAAGAVSGELYTAQLRWGERIERPGTPAEVAAAVAAEIEQQYTEIDWRATALALRAKLGT